MRKFSGFEFIEKLSWVFPYQGYQAEKFSAGLKWLFQLLAYSLSNFFSWLMPYS